MRIEYVAMHINDLEAMRDFFVRYLGGRSGGDYYNTATGFRSYFITFEEGPRPEVITKPRMDDAVKGIDRTGYAHIAFSVGSEEVVDELTATLHAGRYEALSGPRTIGDGYYESCVVAIEGDQIEITI